MKNLVKLMIKNIILDTNVILRYLLNDHEDLSTKACEIFDNIKTGQLRAYITRYIFAELIFVLIKFYQVPKDIVVEHMSDLLKIKNIVIDEKETVINSMDLYLANNISIVDAMLIADSRNLNYQLISFDNKLNNVNSST